MAQSNFRPEPHMRLSVLGREATSGHVPYNSRGAGGRTRAGGPSQLPAWTAIPPQAPSTAAPRSWEVTPTLDAQVCAERRVYLHRGTVTGGGGGLIKDGLQAEGPPLDRGSKRRRALRSQGTPRTSLGPPGRRPSDLSADPRRQKDRGGGGGVSPSWDTRSRCGAHSPIARPRPPPAQPEPGPKKRPRMGPGAGAEEGRFALEPPFPGPPPPFRAGGGVLGLPPPPTHMTPFDAPRSAGHVEGRIVWGGGPWQNKVHRGPPGGAGGEAALDPPLGPGPSPEPLSHPPPPSFSGLTRPPPPSVPDAKYDMQGTGVNDDLG